MSGRADVGDLDNSLPSWVSEHLGETSFMTNEVNQLPSYPPEESPPRDESSDHGGNPKIDTRTPLENKFNIMTQGDLDRLRESCFFPSRIQARIP